MDPAGVLLTGLARQLAHHRGLAAGHARKTRLDLGTVGETMQPLGTSLERSGGVGPPTQPTGAQRRHVRREPPSLRECLDVLHHATTRSLPGKRDKLLVL